VVGSNPTAGFPNSLVHADRSGIAPNVGIAWRPISGSSLLVRAGYQISHDTSVYQSSAYSMATQAFATPITTSASLNNTTCLLSLTQGFPSCPSITADTFAIDPNFRVGYVQIWQLSAQRDLPASLQALVTYRGTKGTRGVQEFLPNTCPYSAVSTACTSAPAGYVFRTSNGNSTREEGIVTLRRRLRSGFTANLTYTYSKSIDDDYSFGGGTGTAVNPQVAQDWLHPERQRGLSTFDQRHLLAVQVQYTTGMGIGGRSLMSGWKGALYKEWTLLTNISAGSGLPQTPLDPVAVPGTGYSGIIRADYTGAPIYATSPGRFLNPAAFKTPLDGQWGNARRNSIIGPNQFSLNASMDRTFRLHDRFNLETRLDAINALNHVVYSSYITTIGNSQFGAPGGVQSMRTVQLTMRLRY
jgi:trimeric autotransporter adhesin